MWNYYKTKLVYGEDLKRKKNDPSALGSRQWFNL